ncbi:virion structural protein [Synechococcus phage S-PM2]|uniref:Virion structural protein n=1 Tax=Synechococcus phage S-PM2 TaxID=238854 RepID=Q5GQG4_BPSYP|nr:virion structural protein [Synechococcus phage S-PM2]CAF34238.1 virion structural protein [Synechococcus phage S-PM2]CFW42381.1 virion structural protein [Synechococcus phage S-PM2]
MARKSIRSNYYIFDASAREVILPGGIQREQLVLITNVTDNKVIYNFSDPELTATEYHISTDIRNVTTTRIVLAYDTTSMSDTDKLQIVYDDFEETIKPSETYHDAVNKSKVSNPQSQIDTDFEYGTQDTKWEALAMINNNPFAYKGQDVLNVSDIQVTTGSKIVTVSSTSNPGAGTAVYIQDSLFPGANGVFITNTSNSNSFTYTAKYPWTFGPGSVYNSARTALYRGVHYTASEIGGAITVSFPGDGSVKVTTSRAHGLEIGNEFGMVGSTGTNVNGSWIVARVESPTIFYYFPDGTPSGTGGTKKLYPRPQGNSVHRAFDGGVKFSTNSTSKNQQSIRQTKRYFRYQSGKGVAFSTGSILAPAIENIDEISSSGTTVTVVAATNHNISKGSQIDVRGCSDNAYNGIYEVTNIVDPFTLQYVVPSTPTQTTTGGEYSVTAINSFGTNLEIGMMDQQNGIFFRYSNGVLSVVRRTSTFQLSGKVSVTNGSTLVSNFTTINGQTTKFAKQLKPGDYVVIRGSSYRVDGIISDTQMVIFPDYRGPTSNDVPVTKTVETEWNQTEWNLDRMDGTGKSGYTLDPTRMQMFYMDYSWYGAGFIRWGFRAEDGNIIYAHKIPNNNVNTEAYMRSGNLPSRYEVNTIPPSTIASKTLSSTDNVLYVADAPVKFPDSGTLRIKKTTSATDGVYEYVNYTSKTSYVKDVFNVSSNIIEVNSTTGLSGGGVQTVHFSIPFSNVVAGKTYYVATVPTSTTFTITDTPGSSTPLTLTDQSGSALSPLSVVSSGSFNGLIREQSGAIAEMIMAAGSSSGVSTLEGIGYQKGQRVIGTGIPDGTSVYSVSGSNIEFSNAVTSANPTATFIPMGTSQEANTFTYSETQPISVELLEATSVPQISHWGSSVIMDGLYDDDRAYVYTVGTKLRRTIGTGGNRTRSVLALRISPSVDNGIIGSFGSRELINRMQLVFRSMDVLSEGQFFVELVLNPIPTISTEWLPVGGTSLAEYSNFDGRSDVDFIGGEVIYGFYAGGSQDNAVPQSYNLESVKEISNSILGGGSNEYTTSSPPDPSGIYPDGPEVVGIRVTNIGSSVAKIDARISWTEAQA